MRDFSDNVFAGTAKYYAKFRPQYPPKLFQDLVHRFGLDGQGRLLDLGCGTGELALPLAEYFERVTAVDPDPGMLEMAKTKALNEKHSHIKWLKGSSKDLTGVEGPFRLVSMGQSFHWMDEETVIRTLYGLIEPGGGLFIAGSIPAPQNRPTARKDAIIKNLLAKYIGPKRRAGDSYYSKPPKNYGELFSGSEFQRAKKRVYETKVVRNIEQELGNLYSMSWARRAYFGSRISDFEREFRSQLSQISKPEGFTNLIRFEVYFLYK